MRDTKFAGKSKILYIIFQILYFSMLYNKSVKKSQMQYPPREYHCGDLLHVPHPSLSSDCLLSLYCKFTNKSKTPARHTQKKIWSCLISLYLSMNHLECGACLIIGKRWKNSKKSYILWTCTVTRGDQDDDIAFQTGLMQLWDISDYIKSSVSTTQQSFVVMSLLGDVFEFALKWKVRLEPIMSDKQKNWPKWLCLS